MPDMIPGSSHQRGAPLAEAFLAGGGEMGARLRAHDWAATPLGLAAAWPPALKTLVAVMLGARQPMFVAWGPERIMLYNDGYATICGARHPAALGRPFREVWFDILDDVEPILERAFAGRGHALRRHRPADAPQRLSGGDLVLLLLHAGAGRDRRGRRHVLRLHRDHRPGDGRAPAGIPPLASKRGCATWPSRARSWPPPPRRWPRISAATASAMPRSTPTGCISRSRASGAGPACRAWPAASGWRITARR